MSSQGWVECQAFSLRTPISGAPTLCTEVWMPTPWLSSQIYPEREFRLDLEFCVCVCVCFWQEGWGLFILIKIVFIETATKLDTIVVRLFFSFPLKQRAFLVWRPSSVTQLLFAKASVICSYGWHTYFVCVGGAGKGGGWCTEPAEYRSVSKTAVLCVKH